MEVGPLPAAAHDTSYIPFATISQNLTRRM